MIINLKFNNKLCYAKILGIILAQHLEHHYLDNKKPEAIVPAPLHPSRLTERGYNQALELARIISRNLNIPINNELIGKIKKTAPQMSLSSKQRQLNLKNAFAIKKQSNYDHIAIIDDVITTGSTISELCRAITKYHNCTIDVWCCAKASKTCQ